MGEQQRFGTVDAYAGQTEQPSPTILAASPARRRQRWLAGLAGLIATGLIVYPILDPADSGARERRATAAVSGNPFSDLSELLRELTVHNVAAMAPALPNLPTLPNIPAAIEQTLKIKAGSTLMNALLDVGFDRSDAHEAVSAMGQVADLRALQVGQPVIVTMTPKVGKEAPNLIAVSLKVSPEKEAIVRRGGTGGTEENFVPETVETPLEQAFARATGTIDDSLYMAANRANVPELVTMEMIKMFSWDVDFQRDIQPGDRFEVLFERFHDDRGAAVKLGNIIFASLTLSGTEYRLYRHTMKDGTVDYFNQNGDSVKKALLRTPIDGAKLTSGFGARKHPILGYTRMHRGVDFGAPAGTPIMAAGDGVIEKAGINSGYGNYVSIRHSGQFKTAYAHLSRFGKGITAGRRVRQGDIIGYVGSTGLSTGPHLHYEVMQGDEQINPQGVKLPTGIKLKGGDLAHFAAARAKIELNIAATPVLATKTAQNNRQ